jgi:cyclophilin family peptidyl-prolyl cis-trans isomerase
MRPLYLLFGFALSAFALCAQEAQAKPRVSIDTSYGPIVVELEPSKAPATVENFLKYVADGHYVGTIFHRVIADFMIQGGGMAEDLREKRTNFPAVRNESSADGLKNLKGTIAMARTENPNSATSQFFINLVDNPKLDFTSNSASGLGYCVFGTVVSGMENVDKIAKARTVWRRGFSDVPDFPVKINKVELLSEK